MSDVFHDLLRASDRFKPFLVLGAVSMNQLERDSSAMEVGVQRFDLFMDLGVGQVSSRVLCETLQSARVTPRPTDRTAPTFLLVNDVPTNQY